MTKFSDIQSILLAAAAARDNGSLLPAPDSLANAADRVKKAIASLIRRGFAIETEVSDAAIVHRTDGDLRYGLFITDAGRTAINVEPVGGPEADKSNSAPASASSPPRQSKSALVVSLLQRGEGATLAELIEATNWLPHTTRAALTGLRKKGHVIDKTKRDDATCYRIVEA
ncbi:MAG: DUF3489 domain-containing protein [Sphingosinicella sp.]|uniref:DUF3489 domain-containing protein n=1 Tax=Sphingosinicella sp. TaxID=1917971 RepID=UPI004037C17B